MENSHEFILDMCKNVRKWCHENYHLFVQGSGIKDEPSIDCWENDNKMHYILHFNFEGKIWDHPKNSIVILDQFDTSSGDEIYDPAIRDSR